MQWKRQGRIGKKDKDKDKDKDRKKLGAKDRPEVKLRVRQVFWIIVSAFFLLAQIHKATLHNIGLRSDQAIKVFFCFVFNFNTMLGTASFVWEQCLCKKAQQI